MASYREYEITPISDLRTMLVASAEKNGTCVAFHEKRQGFYQHISYGRFKDEVEALATALAQHLPKSPRVLLIGKNGYDWALACLSLLSGVGVPVPVDAGASAEELAALAASAQADAVLYDEAAAPKLRGLVGLPAVCFRSFPALIREGRELVVAEKSLFLTPVPEPDAPAAIFYTSGTTGAPKGVMLSQKNIVTVLDALARMQQVEPLDTFLSVLPLSHIYECVLGLLFPLSRGASVAFSEGLGHLMRNMREVHPTHMVTLPFIAERVYSRFFELVAAEGKETAVRRAIAVSDPVRPLAARRALKERLLAEARAPFGGALSHMLVVGDSLSPAIQKGLRQIGIFATQGYGITECAGLAAVGREDVYLDGTAGFALPGTTVDIYNKQPDGTGEIRIKGDHVMLGYFGNDDLTARRLNNGWYYTGDFGYLDEEGYLHIVGRRENCIERADGKLVSPEELELLLGQSPFIGDAVVVGVLDEAKSDYEPAALISPDREHATEILGVDHTEDELEAVIADWVTELNGSLPQHKQIQLFALREGAFPRNPAGRILRADLAKELESAK